MVVLQHPKLLLLSLPIARILQSTYLAAGKNTRRFCVTSSSTGPLGQELLLSLQFGFSIGFVVQRKTVVVGGDFAKT